MAPPGPTHHHHPLRVLTHRQLQSQIEVGLVLVDIVTLDDHVVGEGIGGYRVEVTDHHVDAKAERDSCLIAAVGSHHHVRQRQVLGDLGAKPIPCGEDEDRVHQNDKIALRAETRVRANLQVEVETGGPGF